MSEGNRGPNLKLLICGTPAAGKTTFGCFLQENEEFYHIDVEDDPRHEFSNPPDYQLIVATFGFPIEMISVIRQRKRENWLLWWFDCSRGEAMRHIKRHRTAAAVERQYAKIHPNGKIASEIRRVFSPNILTINEGSRKSPADLWQYLQDNDLRLKLTLDSIKNSRIVCPQSVSDLTREAVTTPAT